ncbi:PREDICTED: uncharacterized protein LOC105622340 [Atta cephalotes]|uniref:CCHC-type domain-containing protein n=1 Tax=Atta cephalotes TaxID=12957 RepID=A0A158NNP1_ATTCE|nr:PREDICTED: uncharacterized protein LOC105622340 [Atta cephalotes]
MADNGIQTLDIFNKMQNFPPLNVTEQRNVGRSWCAWKQNFLSFLQKEDAKEIYKNQWTIILLMLIGPDGKKVYKNLFPNTQTKDLGTVLLKLDMFFIFGFKEKQKSESIDQYIDCLMLAALASNHSDPVNIVKEKIIKDIKNYNFTEKVFIQSEGENLESYLQSLDLDKITLFWKQCEKLTLQRNHEVTQTQPFSDLSLIEMECVRCGTCHSRNRCPAYGLQCDNCKGYNHFTNKCKGKYVSNCTKCGMSHVQSRCHAFGQTCVKCGKINHFSWLCKIPFVKNCLRCGKDHAISMCPAQGHTCSRCNKPNHFEEKCLSK